MAVKKGFGLLFLGVFLCMLLSLILSPGVRAQDVNPPPPDHPAKLIFIHHSCGENWLTDGNGNLGQALAENNYYVSDTNYGWGPDAIGDRTDIPDWLAWFTGPESDRYLTALYQESGQLASYTRLFSDPGGENQIVMFKSCFPNSNLAGSPNDPPASSPSRSVGGAKYVYNQLLRYFVTRPEKLFVVITAPPVQDPTYAANARAFNEWLVNDWLAENQYPYPNVAVWDFHNVLTHPDNHHRYQNGSVEYVTQHGDGTLYYHSQGDNHPRPEGNRKATEEFVPFLNGAYQRWQASDPGPAPTQEPGPTEESSAENESASGRSADNFLFDFEGADLGWQAFWDQRSSTRFSCETEPGTGLQGTSGLHLDFALAPESWATCSLFFDPPRDLSGTYGISFQYRADQAGLVFDVNAHQGPPEALASYIFQVPSSPESQEGWARQVVPWQAVKRVSWEENPGSSLDPVEVSGLSFGVGTGSGEEKAGSIWIDEVVILREAPRSQDQKGSDPQPAEESHPAASSDEQPGPKPGFDLPFCPGALAGGVLSLVFSAGMSRRRKEG